MIFPTFPYTINYYPGDRDEKPSVSIEARIGTRRVRRKMDMLGTNRDPSSTYGDYVAYLVEWVATTPEYKAAHGLEVANA